MRQRVPVVGDRVVSLDFPCGDPIANAMQGTVTKVFRGSLSGGNRAMLLVKWENGFLGRKQERMVAMVEMEKKET